MVSIDHVVFDMGNVFVRWDRRWLYEKLIDDKAELDWFLDNVATIAFNHTLDMGRDWTEACETLAAAHPKYRAEIMAYDSRWAEMLGPEIEGTVDLGRALRAGGYQLHLLSNVATHRFHQIAETIPFLKTLTSRVLSGDVGLAKPEPEIYRLLQAQAGFEPERTVFLDDVRANCETARSLGWHAIEFTTAEAAKRDLRALGVKLAV
jgi:2-haloacid dehalogenase